LIIAQNVHGINCFEIYYLCMLSIITVDLLYVGQSKKCMRCDSWRCDIKK